MSKKDVMPSTAPDNREAFEAWVIERATLFSVVLFKGRGRKERWEYPTLLAAVTAAADNPRKMVYAATESGRAVMIAPKDYSMALTIVGREARD